MNLVRVSAKTQEEALKQVLIKLNAREDEVVYTFREIPGGLFKSPSVECSGYLKLDVIQAAAGYLEQVIKAMGLEVNMEVNNKDEMTSMKMYTSNNPVVIGKNGQNLEAFNVLVRQFVNAVSKNGPRITLDVEDYKDRQIARIERLAKKCAKEVVKTKIDIEMDAMNAYERRIVHNCLSNFKGVKTESTGEEPNRKVVIKYQDID